MLDRFGTALSWFSKNVAEPWYKPIAGHYDATAVDSPSYSPVNFLGDYYAPNNPIIQPGNKYPPTAPTAPAVSYAPVAPSTIDYWNAEIAKHYGMSAETAYQEALSNTSYQRAMQDMQAAGLNPAAMFGSGNGSGANGVSYVSRPGSSGSNSTTARSNDDLFSEGAYYGLSTMIGLVTALLMKSPTGYWIGNSAAQGALGAANAGYKSRNR